MISTKFLTSTLVVALLLAVPAAVSAQANRRGKSRKPVTSAPATSGPAADADFDQFVKRADEARLAEHFDEAIDLYSKALKLRPRWPEGWWYVGAIFYERDMYLQARDSFRNLVSLDPKRGPAWGLLGLCEFQTKDYEQSVISLQRARTYGVGDNKELQAVIRYHAALLYIHFQEFEIAYDILSEFLRDGNESPKVIEAFGLTMLRMPSLPDEVPADKREEVMIAGQAGFNMSARRSDRAREAFNTLLAGYPNQPNVHYAFGVYLLGQDADAAMKEFKRELEISPAHFPAMVQMAFEYLKRDQYTEALPLAEKAVQLSPRMFAARNVLGRVLLELGQLDRAIKELEEGVKLAPASPEMHFALARAYTRAGRKDDAARERETFKRLQDEYSQQRDAQRPGNDQSKPTEKQNP